MMDERKIFIVNLSKGQLGEGNANLLGGMIITKIYLAAMSRADLTEGELKKLPNFYMYVDEFQSFANESFADILSEARKYKLALVVAHQYIKQMDEKVADAVFGNVGTQIMFRVGAPDAEVLEKEYAPVFVAEDMVSLGMYQIYLKLMIDGVASHPFSAVSLPPIAPPAKSIREEVLASSREVYGRARADVEKTISEWYGVGGSAAPTQSAPVATAQPERVAPRSDFAPRAPVSPIQKSSMVFERERHHALEREDEIEQSSQPVQSKPVQAVPPKTERPFAQAFKNIPRPEVRMEHHDASAARPMQPQAKSNVPQAHKGKGSGPGSPHLSTLKAALADALREDKKVVAPQSQPAVAQKQAAPVRPPETKVEQHKPVPQSQPKVEYQKPTEQILTPQDFSTKNLGRREEKIAEVASAPKTLFEETPAPTPAPIVEKEKVREVPPESPKLKEVPEDVLTALLRGDD
jgi:hypothetical protein